MKLINSNRFSLAGTSGAWLHLATVSEGVREFMCFAELKTRKIYIEEATGGSLQFIEDDALAEGIHSFLTERGVLDMHKPLLPDDKWLRKKK